MFKVLITITLILILTTSIYSQAEANGIGGFRGGSFGGGFGGKALVQIQYLWEQVKVRCLLLLLQEKLTHKKLYNKVQNKLHPLLLLAAAAAAAAAANNPQNNFKSQPSSSQSPFQQQPRSNFFGGGLGGGLGGFGNMIMASIMGNFIGQALFGWMLPHPTPVSAPAPTQSSSVTLANNGTSNNQAQK